MGRALKILTESAYENLSKNIFRNKNLYYENKICLNDFFRGKKYCDSIQSYYNLPELKKLEEHSIKAINENDLINTRLLYDSLKDLNPLQATQKEFWTYLAHTVYKDYVHSRWMHKPGNKTIKSRYFVTGTKGLFENAISRLWWYGYLTYQSSNNDKYFLTKVLLTNQQICKDVLDESYSNNKKILHALLKGLKRYMEQVQDDQGITTIWRKTVQSINLDGGVLVLDFMTEDELEDLTYQKLLSFDSN